MSRVKSIAIAIPWCCIVTFLSPLISYTATGVGMVVDTLAHYVLLPASLILQVWLTVHFLKCQHEGHKRSEMVMLIFGWVITIASLLFHFTPLHDTIVHGH